MDKQNKTIIGVVDRIIFHDQNNDRAILSIIKEDGKSCRVIGNISKVNKDDSLKAIGVWRKDDKYGWQFIAETIHNTSQIDNEQDGGMMHSIDFSNALKNPLKEFRRTSGIYDYSNDDDSPEDLFVNIEGTIYNSDKTILIRVPEDITSFEFPETVKEIGAAAFMRCKHLKEIKIGDNIETIPDNAFIGCTGLTNVVIGERIKSIGNYAFSECSGLSSVTIGNAVTSIGRKAFAGCTQLENLVVPASVMSIGKGAFISCKNYRIDRVFDVSWDDVIFDENSITVVVGKCYSCFKKLQIHLDGVKWAMNDVKTFIMSHIPNLRVKMLSKDKGEILNVDKLREVLFVDVVKDIALEDIDFSWDIGILTEWNYTVCIHDVKIPYNLNCIRKELAQMIPVLRIHFSSLVDAEVLNINELHEITKFLDDRKVFLNTTIPERLHEIRRKYFRSFLPTQMSQYVEFLFENHPINIYPIVHIYEHFRDRLLGEDGALFTMVKENQPFIVWENFNDSRATYVFPCNEDNYEEKMRVITDFIRSDKENKRSYLRTNDCRSVFGEKPFMISHNNFDSWKQRLYCEIHQ